MEKHTMTLNHSPHMYDKPYYGLDTTFLNFDDVSGNKLFCTFSELDEVDSLIEDIKYKYTVLYNKIFVLQVKSNNEYVCTYNIDQVNAADLPSNTILVHRKKETNTLYTINSLNSLIKHLNGGVLDTTYKINWPDYQNTVLLTQGSDLKKLATKIHKIVVL